MDEELVMKDPFSAFADFYKEMQGKVMDPEEEMIMTEIFEAAKGNKDETSKISNVCIWLLCRRSVY